MASITDQHALNRRRWRELCADPIFATQDFRVETDRFGQALVTSTPPSFERGGFQFNIGAAIQRHPPGQTPTAVRPYFAPFSGSSFTFRKLTSPWSPWSAM